MQCPECGSTNISKNGKQKGKQNHICKECRRQFFDTYSPLLDTRMSLSGSASECTSMVPDLRASHTLRERAIERVKGVHHTTVITWVKQVGELLPDAYAPETVPQVGELDELETFVGQKNKIWLWTWVLGDPSAETFQPLWAVVATWQCYFYVTDGWSVYPGFIPEGDQIVSKTYMTRVEGENTRLHRKTLCYSRVSRNAGTFNSIVTSLRDILPTLMHSHTARASQ